MKILSVSIGVFFAVVNIGLWWYVPATVRDEPNPHRDSASGAPSIGMNPDFSASDLQASVRVVFDNPKALGWRQTGTMKLSRDDAADAVRAMMAAKGYIVRHSVEDARHTLEMYGKEGARDVMWMIWSSGDGESGFSWGISR